jgi:methyl-accepting chemotaxis protein
MLCDLNFNIVYASKLCFDTLDRFEPSIRSVAAWRGFRPAELVGSSLEDFFSETPEELSNFRDPRNMPYSGVVRFGPYIVDLKVTQLQDESGRSVSYAVFWHDMTDQIKADVDYKAGVHAISDTIEALRLACSGGLKQAMTAMASGNLGIEMRPSTKPMDMPEQADLALMATHTNQLREAIIGFEEEYNLTRESILDMVAKQIQVSTVLAKAMESLSSGDLTVTVDADADSSQATAASLAPEIVADIFGGMRDQTIRSVDEYNRARTALADLVAKTKVASDQIAQASSEITTGTDDLSQRTEEQASSLEETASSMEEMTSTVKQNADNAREANQLAAQAREVAEKGGAVVGKAVRSMEEINTASKRIADIISVIDEIAFQTNLLALNAAVEAARVGEQGRGFAVVAAEVRNLAGRSATAAKEIKALVQDSVQKVQEGSNEVNQSGQTLDEIVLAVKKVADIISEISAASQEQSSGIEQVNKAVMQMDQITQQNAALVEETAAASNSMTQQATGLQSLVNRFQVEDSLVAAARSETEAQRTSAPQAAASAPRSARFARSANGKSAPRRSFSASGANEDGFEEF